MGKKTTLGVIVGNRGFFPAELVRDGREEILSILDKRGFSTVALSPEDTKFGGVETWEDAQKCGKLFKEHRDEIDGILVTLPNFGDEKAVANALKLSGLKVPVLIHAYPDEAGKMDVKHRRDSFCGKLSVCNNLNQYGIPFSLTSLHTVDPQSESFSKDLDWFGGVCRVVRGLRSARIGAVGARTGPFNTVRYSEKLLEGAGISVETIDLSEVFGRIDRLKDDDKAVRDKIAAIKGYCPTAGVPERAILKMAKFGVVLDKWVEDFSLNALCIQCWTALEEFYGVVPCAIMSMMSESLIPNACEVDAAGALAMYALQLASGAPSALVDWNNNYGDDPNRAVIFHCSNLPKSVFYDVKMSYQDIIARSVGVENAYGTCVGRIKAGPITFARISTDDVAGMIRTYIGEGEATDDGLETFGGYGVLKVENLQELLRYACEAGFEHHVAINPSLVAKALAEAFDRYMGWDVYYHNNPLF
ncbi:MAG: L-fucose/L-arabinose isomerase family protein [bacterium]